MANAKCKTAGCKTEAGSANAPMSTLAALAATTVGAEIAIVSQRDGSAYRCAARFGLEAHKIECETFCRPMADDPAPLVTTDARGEARLACHANVMGAPFVQASLSVPVLDASQATIGAICVMAMAPRAWSEADIAALTQIASIASALIHGAAIASAMDTAHDGIGITDANGFFTYMNHAHVLQFGYDDASELLGKSWSVLYEPAQAERVAAAALPMIARNGVWTGEAIGRRRDGGALFQEMTLSALASGGTICATRDISERKRLETKSLRLAEMRARAEAASAAKSAFLAQMSHEIRTPLNGIVAMTGALREMSLTDQQREIVCLIESCGETLEHLVSDILDLSRIEAGKIKFEAAPFDLVKAVEAAVNIAAPSAAEKQLRLETRFQAGASGAFVGDAVRIKQLIVNLVSNAVKFTHAGAVRVRVSAPEDLAIGACGDVAIEVTDTGIGFDGQDAARLFRRFEQGDDCIARTYGGTGLGLTICQGLAEGMGGTIRCTSAVGAGSTFTVTLPLKRARPLLAPQAAAENKAQRGLRVLVAEDHATNRRVVEIILATAGAELTFAANGFEAVEARRRGAFDLVLMDMLMPVMSGLEAIAAIRALESREGLARIPIAVLSANVIEHQRQLALRAGADLYLAKPITPAALLAGVETVCAPT